MNRARINLAALVWVATLCTLTVGAAVDEPAPFNPAGRPNRSRFGPWDSDALVLRAGPNGSFRTLATFPRAGVPTVARLTDGRLVAAHQYFPEDNDADFDKVAVHFSADEGGTWSGPQVIRVPDLPAGMRFPFDPTLVPLPDGRVRLYFTSLRGQRFEQDRPAIYSAISSNALDYAFEPGMRFGVEGRPVIDCAVVLHRGVFHLFAPDNGAGLNPGAAQRAPEDRPRNGMGYHATGTDGLTFTRKADMEAGHSQRWLGAAQSDGEQIRFFGTGGPGGVWSATSRDGATWTPDPAFPSTPGADPGAVKLRDGSWLLVVTGPPRNRPNPGNQPGPGPGQRPPEVHPLVRALDANHDGVIDREELENAVTALRRLDYNGDGRLTSEEFRPALPKQQPDR